MPDRETHSGALWENWPAASCCGGPRVCRDVDACYDHAKVCAACDEPSVGGLCPTHAIEAIACDQRQDEEDARDDRHATEVSALRDELRVLHGDVARAVAERDGMRAALLEIAALSGADWSDWGDPQTGTWEQIVADGRLADHLLVYPEELVQAVRELREEADGA